MIFRRKNQEMRCCLCIASWIWSSPQRAYAFAGVPCSLLGDKFHIVRGNKVTASLSRIGFERVRGGTGPRGLPLQSAKQGQQSSSLRASESCSLSTDEKKKIGTRLNKQFLKIALPALIQLTAEPLASLVDTAYLGRLGPEVLGGAGASSQFLCKLYAH
jgi:hypothetical protein